MNLLPQILSPLLSPPHSSSTLEYHKANLYSTGHINCSLSGTSTAVCIESFGGTEANSPGVSTETYTGTDIAYVPVTITAGKIRAAPASTTGSGAVPAQTSGAGVAESTTETGSTEDAGPSSTAAPTETSTGAAAIITGAAGWVLGGAAVAFAML